MPGFALADRGCGLLTPRSNGARFGWAPLGVPLSARCQDGQDAPSMPRAASTCGASSSFR